MLQSPRGAQAAKKMGEERALGCIRQEGGLSEGSGAHRLRDRRSDCLPPLRPCPCSVRLPDGRPKCEEDRVLPTLPTQECRLPWRWKPGLQEHR